jgi:protein arginine kinase
MSRHAEPGRDSAPLPNDQQLGEWLRGTGPQADVAICTRVRFARNLQTYRFSPTISAEESTDLVAFVTRQITSPGFYEPVRVVDVRTLDELERRLLVERHLISRELAGQDKPRAVAINDRESVSIMINEEDHLRSQVFGSGFCVAETYRHAERLDEALMTLLPFAFSEEFGFLTSCPTNTGTGLRISVMLHLPGLVWANEIEKATSTAQKIHLAVRGLYGEGSRALGDFYQVSNQVTLGRSEEQILQDVTTAVDRLLAWERKVRGALLTGEPRARTLDRVFRALGTLERAYELTSDEAMTCLSAVRFGVQQGLVPEITLAQVNKAQLLAQPAHLQRLSAEKLSAPDRDQKRAELVRQIFGRAR